MRFIQQFNNEGWKVEHNGQVLGNVRKYFTKGKTTESWEAIHDGNETVQGFRTRNDAALYLHAAINLFGGR